jgi:hypothetical protein
MIRALRQAVLAQLRLPIASGGCGLDASTCDEGPPDGQPPPKAGKLFVAVHRFRRRKVQMSSSEWEYSGCLTVSIRINEPWDSIGSATIQKTLLGVNDRCDAICAVMENAQYVVMNAANAIINATAGGPWDGFVEPFLLMDEGDAELVSGDWFHAQPEKSAAVRKTITMTGARRIQRLPSVQVQTTG